MILILVCQNPTSSLNSLKQMYEGGLSPPGTPFPGSVWNVKCQYGYYWSDGSIINRINCSAYNWTGFAQPCVRMFTLHNQTI